MYHEIRHSISATTKDHSCHNSKNHLPLSHILITSRLDYTNSSLIEYFAAITSLILGNKALSGATITTTTVQLNEMSVS